MDSVVLLLSPLDMLINAERELSIPSEEFLGLSETGDLIDSLLGCLLREALIERGMDFVHPKCNSSFSLVESNSLQLLQFHLVSQV
ncbi:hypothetical protein V6N13_114086 [Hibiscus sabdariffa]